MAEELSKTEYARRVTGNVPRSQVIKPEDIYVEVQDIGGGLASICIHGNLVEYPDRGIGLSMEKAKKVAHQTAGELRLKYVVVPQKEARRPR